MNRLFPYTAFAVGVLAVAWIGAGYLPGNPLALALVGLIGAFFLVGAAELHGYQQATFGLNRVLAATTEAPEALGPWLAALHPSLQNPVRLRVEGERVALPGPALTPFLAGLLVLLGMLGTFLGMVVTLKGTGVALENAVDVEAIRTSLSAPIRGLGLAFGTSVAGVAASAMLGLMSALVRRDRLRAGQRLETSIATVLRAHSRTHQREEALRLLGVQAQALPELVGTLQAVLGQMERQAARLQEGLLAGQDEFHDQARQAYTELATSVNRTLTASLVQSAHIAGQAVEPVVRAALDDMARQTAALHATLTDATQRHLDGVTVRLEARTAAWLDGVAERMDRSAGRWSTAWASVLADQERVAADRHQRICGTLEQTTRQIAERAEAQALAIMVEIGRLVEAASEAPQAASQVIGEMRRTLSESLVRDTVSMDERNRLAEMLRQLMDTVSAGSVQQRHAIDALLSASSEVLDRAGARFAQTVDAESRVLNAVTAQVSGSAVEVASLGEGFALAVQLFSRASEQLLQQLARIETALGQSMARSDEQLAYCVAQAREIIDLTLGSQKQIVEDLQQLGRAAARPAAAMPAVADVA
jgi:hypothetical protein